MHSSSYLKMEWFKNQYLITHRNEKLKILDVDPTIWAAVINRFSMKLNGHIQAWIWYRGQEWILLFRTVMNGKK